MAKQKFVIPKRNLHEDGVPSWQTRFFVKPYFIKPAPTLQQGLELLQTTACVCSEARQQSHKHAHYDLPSLWDDGLGPGGFLLASASASESVLWPRIKQERRYTTVAEAGDLVELPWILSDASWLRCSGSDRDVSGASGKTSQGACLAIVSTSDTPLRSLRTSVWHEYSASLQSMLNHLMFGWSSLDDERVDRSSGWYDAWE